MVTAVPGVFYWNFCGGTGPFILGFCRVDAEVGGVQPGFRISQCGARSIAQNSDGVNRTYRKSPVLSVVIFRLRLFSVSGFMANSVVSLLRGTIVNRTYGAHKNL